jgi:hypothetical protein
MPRGYLAEQGRPLTFQETLQLGVMAAELNAQSRQIVLAYALDASLDASQDRGCQVQGEGGSETGDFMVTRIEEGLEILSRHKGDVQAEIWGQFRWENDEIQMLRLGATREGESDRYLEGLVFVLDAEHRESDLPHVKAQVARGLGDILGPACIPIEAPAAQAIDPQEIHVSASLTRATSSSSWIVRLTSGSGSSRSRRVSQVLA